MSWIVVLPEHLHVPAEWQNADAVLRFAESFTDLVAADIEADEKLFALHAARLGDEKMPQLVDKDHRPQADGDLQHHGYEPQNRVHIQRSDQAHTQRVTSCRAHRSSSSNFSKVGSASKWCASSTLRQAGTISVKCNS